ncbi:MAG: hypothetical protein ACOYON_12495 [Fimbriimonas sp.]
MSSVEVGAFYPERRLVPNTSGVALDVVHGGASVAQPHAEQLAVPKPLDVAFAARLSVVFMVVTFCAFLTSGIMANVMLEKARVETSNFMTRAKDAESASKLLASQVRVLENPDRLQRMAAKIGLVAPDATLHPSE